MDDDTKEPLQKQKMPGDFDTFFEGKVLVIGLE